MPPKTISTRKNTRFHGGTRRTFLKSACAVTGAAGAILCPGNNQAASLLPKVRLGNFDIARLVMGANPVWGYSHRGRLLDQFMVQHYTDDKIIETLHAAERAGINTWQTNFPKRFPNVWKRYRDEGGSMNLIILYDFRETSIKEAATFAPIAIVHHGGITDYYWKNSNMQIVRDFISEVKDCGVLAGVSSHKPEVVKHVSDEDWENDFFMTCFYNLTIDKKELKNETGFVPLDEMYADDNPAKMCRSIRETTKPCLAFKILAAGRVCDRKETVEESFRFAFANIKPNDAVIVGMIPRFEDQVSENVHYVMKYGIGV